MTEKIRYEFGNFVIDPFRRSLSCDGKTKQLRSKAFDLLLFLVVNHGRAVPRAELVRAVWGNTLVSHINFDVTLSAVRKALGESAADPKHIVLTPKGYLFFADVREIHPAAHPNLSVTSALKNDFDSQILNNPSQAHVTAEDDRLAERTTSSTPDASLRATISSTELIKAPTSHFIVGTLLYSSLYVCALFLEVVYRWEQMARQAKTIVLPVFIWMISTTLVALAFDWRNTVRGRSRGPLRSILVFTGAVIVLYSVLAFLLPHDAVTQATFQTRSAHGAYLKNSAYFLFLGIVFLALPVHLIAALQRQCRTGNAGNVLLLLTDGSAGIVPAGAIYIPVKWLALILAGITLGGLLLTNYLLDNLEPGKYMSSFVQLATWRLILAFAFGLECLFWYKSALNEIKREYAPHGRANS